MPSLSSLGYISQFRCSLDFPFVFHPEVILETILKFFPIACFWNTVWGWVENDEIGVDYECCSNFLLLYLGRTFNITKQMREISQRGIRELRVVIIIFLKTGITVAELSWHFISPDLQKKGQRIPNHVQMLLRTFFYILTVQYLFQCALLIFKWILWWTMSFFLESLSLSTLFTWFDSNVWLHTFPRALIPSVITSTRRKFTK